MNWRPLPPLSVRKCRTHTHSKVHKIESNKEKKIYLTNEKRTNKKDNPVSELNHANVEKI